MKKIAMLVVAGSALLFAQGASAAQSVNLRGVKSWKWPPRARVYVEKALSPAPGAQVKWPDYSSWASQRSVVRQSVTAKLPHNDYVVSGMVAFYVDIASATAYLSPKDPSGKEPQLETAEVSASGKKILRMFNVLGGKTYLDIQLMENGAWKSLPRDQSVGFEVMHADRVVTNNEYAGFWMVIYDSNNRELRRIAIPVGHGT
ncbi:MAG: hypothetical protein KGI60_02490 [Patescibacteria group bacterium]|nr:hypothetical protein [Patescibacteria group bacterium]